MRFQDRQHSVDWYFLDMTPFSRKKNNKKLKETKEEFTIVPAPLQKTEKNLIS